MTTLDSFTFAYKVATKLASVRYQCSACGTFVGKEALTCQNPKCGADLR
jgi:Zn finger protein HypA/HybF involved in hydrogenase expression